MRSTTIFSLIFLSFLLFGASGGSEYASILAEKTSSKEISSIQTSGFTNGIFWSYKEHNKRSLSVDLDLGDAVSFSKQASVTKNTTINMPVISDLQELDFFYERYVKNVMRDQALADWKRENGTGYQQTIGNKTGNIDNIFTAATNSFYRYDWFQAKLPVDKNDMLGQMILGLASNTTSARTTPHLGFGLFIPDWYTTNVTVEVVQTHSVPKLDWLRTEYEYMDANEYLITYLYDEAGTFDNLTDDLVVLQERLVPQFQVIKVISSSFPVTVQETSKTNVSLDAAYEYTGQYNETMFGHEVLISQNKDYIFGWYGIENATLDLSQQGRFSVKGHLEWNLTRDIKFSNGTGIPESKRPIWARSSIIALDGNWTHQFTESGTVIGRAAYQQLAQAIRTRASTDITDQLLVWMNLIPSTMFGYSDMDNSGDVSLKLNGTLIEIMDQVMAIGITHGIHVEDVFEGSNNINAQAYWKLGDTIIADNETDQSVPFSRTINETSGIDPNGGAFDDTEILFDWDTPITDTQGNTTFGWSIDYVDYPVLWQVTNGTYVIPGHVEITDFGYAYTLIIDPENGESTLSNTYETTGVENATVKTMLDGLSMATYKHDLFMSMERIDDDMDSADATPETDLATAMGTTPVLEQQFGGAKEQYSLGDGNNYDSKVTAINVITASGNTEIDTVNLSWDPFHSSNFGRKVALGLLQWTVNNRTSDAIDWYFRENIVVTAYPTWNGYGITHDPTYSAVYAVSPQEVTTTTGTGTTTTTTTGPNTNTETTSSVFWPIIASSLGIFVVPLIRSRRK